MNYSDEDFILALYASSRTGQHAVYGAIQKNGVRYNYGRHKAGDVFLVLREDAMKMRNVFVRPTDGQPFNVISGRIVDASSSPAQLARQTIGRVSMAPPPPPPSVPAAFIPQAARDAGAEHGPEKMEEALLQIPGVGAKTVRALVESGVTIASVSQMDSEELQARGVTRKAAEAIVEYFS